MRVGIIGGSAAGLATAWLLDQAHDVVLLERENHLGGLLFFDVTGLRPNQRMQRTRARFALATAALHIERRGCAAAAAQRPRR